jgi:hypothetical protein
VEVFLNAVSNISTRNKFLHFNLISPTEELLQLAEILLTTVDICTCNTSTKRSSNQAPFDKISKSGDGGGSGGTLDTLVIFTEVQAKHFDVNNKRLIMEARDTENKIEVLSFRDILTSGGVRSLARSRKDGSRNNIFEF